MVVVAFIIACSFLFVLAKLGFMIQENLGYVFLKVNNAEIERERREIDDSNRSEKLNPNL